MSSQPLNTPGEAEDDELVAYLDGELDAETARRLEQRLEADQQLRRKYRQMAASWDLLDQLPRAKVDDAFTRHTVETVAIAVSDDVQTTEMSEPRRRRLRWGITGIAALAAAATGFALIAALRPSSNDKLLRDLPVIENLELYQQAHDIDFLRKMHDDGLFPEESSDAP